MPTKNTPYLPRNLRLRGVTPHQFGSLSRYRTSKTIKSMLQTLAEDPAQHIQIPSSGIRLRFNLQRIISIYDF